MSSSPRLRDDCITTLERQVLDSAKRDVPHPKSQDALLVALGLGSVLTLSTAAQAGSALGSAAAAALPPASGAALTAKAGVILFTKWMAIGLVASGAAGGAWIMATTPPSSPPSRSLTVGVSGPARATRPLAGAPAKSQPPDALALSSPEETALPVPTAASTASARGKILGRPSIAEELALVDEARHALARGAPEQVLSLLATRQRSFSPGAFAPEAELLRAEALLALGRSGEASAVARRFLEQDSGSPHATRMRRLLKRADHTSQAGVETNHSARYE